MRVIRLEGHDVAPPIDRADDLDRIVRWSLAHVRHALEADAVQIQLVDDARGTPFLDLLEGDLPATAGLPESAARSGCRLTGALLPAGAAAIAIPAHPDPVLGPLLEGAGMTLLAVAPLSHAGLPRGGLLVARRGPRGWEGSELRRLDAVAGLTGALVERALRLRHAPAIPGTEQVLRHLAARLVSVREEERARIAREIHDELGQALTVLKMDLSWSRRRLARRWHGACRLELSRRLRAMSALVDETIRSVRRIAADLRPSVLDQLGLEAAVEWQAQEFESRTGIRCLLRAGLKGRPVAAPIAVAVFRIFQETLTNVARHSGASRVTVRMRREKGELLLDVRDNGRGIPGEAVRSPGSIGLLGMRERALLLRGDLAVMGRPGRGTMVRLRIPLDVPGVKTAAPGPGGRAAPS